MQKLNKGWLTLLLLLGACGGAIGGTNAGGESHFLRHCFEGCGDLECVADICTRSCLVSKDGCGDLTEGAACTNASVEPGSVAVCDVSCAKDGDCAKLGVSFTCEAGFCRSSAVPEPQGGAGAPPDNSGGSTASGGSTPSGGSSGGPSRPPDYCSLPFDAGSCEAAIGVFTHQDGQCVPATYGGCDGNQNRFGTLEECMATCLGQPGRQACPDGRESRKICIQCGPAGGCAKEMTVCALPCTSNTTCQGSNLWCGGNGVCEAYGCE